MTQADLERLFPDGTIVRIATLADENESLLPGEERALTGAMVPARRKEFAAGRNTARRALAGLGLSPVTLLRRDAGRDIDWPPGVTGSISHTRDLCAVACTRSAAGVASIGLDVEQAGPLDDEVVETICRVVELRDLADYPAPLPSDWPRLLFAMKEAAYKAWYPQARREIPFHQMRVRVDVAARSYQAVVEGDPARISGRFTWDERHVAAGSVLTA